jgi:hypothetical protein
MKIIKKPKILPCECAVCGAVFQPKKKDIDTRGSVLVCAVAVCPFCKSLVSVNFEKDGAE